MSDRDNLALLLVMILISYLLGCAPGESDFSSCGALRADCPGIANDYKICSYASDLEQEVREGVRYFSYYNCALGRRTPTLTIDSSCVVRFGH